jgi:hypothetical protein
MTESPPEGLTDLAQLPRTGTGERREWDRTIRQANELYPDWSWIRIGNTRFRRDAYEKRHAGHAPETGLGKRSRRPEPSPFCPAARSP